MRRSQSYKLILLAGSAAMLQGCVAAVVPIAAGGLIGGSSVSHDSENEVLAAQPVTDPTVTVERSADRVATPASEDAPALASIDAGNEPVGTMAPPPAISTSAATAQPSPVETDPAPEPALAAAPEVEAPAAASPLRVVAVDRQAAFTDGSSVRSSVSAAQAAAALSNVAPAEEPVTASAVLARTPREPEPAPAAASEPTTRLAMNTAATAPAVIPPPPPPPPPAAGPTPPRPLATGEFAALINYANRQRSRSAQNRASAVLADRSSLQPDRAACNGSEATVLIDLDPDGDTFDPTLVERAAPGLPSALAQLRTAGIKIVWISSNPVNQITSIRDALNRSGLDLENTDQVLLMRYPEDRKQTRREDLAANTCLIAIAGDTRTDFDELFEYLLNPQAAATLDPLMGNGWFLIPSPLATERPNP